MSSVISGMFKINTQWFHILFTITAFQRHSAFISICPKDNISRNHLIKITITLDLSNVIFYFRSRLFIYCSHVPYTCNKLTQDRSYLFVTDKRIPYNLKTKVLRNHSNQAQGETHMFKIRPQTYPCYFYGQ